MAIDRAPFNALVDDSGAGTDGTPWNKDKIKTVILDPADAAYLSNPITQDVVFGGNHNIRRNTADGADTGRVVISGGGNAPDSARGSYISFHGNEHAAPGLLQMAPGNVAAGSIQLLRGDYNVALQIESATGVVLLPLGALKFPTVAVPSTDPNTVDDYKEGVWTVNDQSGAGLAITTVTSANYVKHGQTVVASFYIAFPATANGAAVTLGGLPYNPMGGYASGAVGHCTKGALVQVFCTGGNAIYLKDWGGNPFTNANMSGVALAVTLAFRAAQ